MKTSEAAVTTRCPMVDAHVHADTISYGSVEKQTVFWLDHHPSLVEYEAALLKALWEAAPELLAALEEAADIIAVLTVLAPEKACPIQWKQIQAAISKAKGGAQ